MRNPLRTPATVVLLSLLAGPRTLPAQQPAAPAAPPAKQGPVITVDFVGGTLDDYIVAVQKAAAKTPVNVIRADDAAKIRIPAISLKDVNPGTALEAVEWIFRGNDERKFEVSDFRHDDDGSTVYAITHISRGPSRDAESKKSAPQRRSIEVLSIRELIEPAERQPEVAAVTVTRDHVLSAVDSALRMNRADGGGGAEMPEVLFHEDTGLLIVRGSDDDIGIARTVVLRIREDLFRRRDKAGDAGRDARAAEQELRKVEATLGVKQREFQILSDRYERARKMKDAGQASDEQVQAAEIERAQAELDVQLLEAQHEQLAQIVEELRASQAATPELKAGAYDIADLAAAAPEIAQFVGLLLRASGGSAEVKPGEAGRGPTLAVNADAVGHDLVGHLFRMIRKAAGRSAPGDQRGGAR